MANSRTSAQFLLLALVAILFAASPIVDAGKFITLSTGFAAPYLSALACKTCIIAFASDTVLPVAKISHYSFVTILGHCFDCGIILTL